MIIQHYLQFRLLFRPLDSCILVTKFLAQSKDFLSDLGIQNIVSMVCCLDSWLVSDKADETELFFDMI